MYYAFVKMYQFIKLAKLGILRFCIFKTDENETKTQIYTMYSHFVLLCFLCLLLQSEACKSGIFNMMVLLIQNVRQENKFSLFYTFINSQEERS